MQRGSNVLWRKLRRYHGGREPLWHVRQRLRGRSLLLRKRVRGHGVEHDQLRPLRGTMCDRRDVFRGSVLLRIGLWGAGLRAALPRWTHAAGLLHGHVREPAVPLSELEDDRV